MIKLFGILMIVASTTLLGVFKSTAMKKRIISLQDMKTSLNLLKSEIMFSRNSLKEAFENIANVSKNADVFKYTAEMIEEYGIKNAWKYGTEMAFEGTCLKKEDTEVIALLGGELGMTDTENQLKNIDYISELLNKCIADANDEYTKTAKLCRSVGVLSGLLIAIVLI